MMRSNKLIQLPQIQNHSQEDQKYLRFIWKEFYFQYSCLPNGLTSAPRLFTKLMKPVFATLRQYGYKNAGYIDYSLLIGFF
jgi:hypothetical protein